MSLPPLDTSAYLKRLVEDEDPDGLTLLGIPDGVTPSRLDAEGRLSEIEILWKNPRNQRGPVGSRLKTLRPRLDEVKRALAEDQAFAALLDAAGRSRTERQKGAERDLREALEQLAKAIAGHATYGRPASPADQERWARFCRDQGIPPAELERLLSEHGVARDTAAADVKPYEKSSRAQIRGNLDVFATLAHENACSSLYKYLDLTTDHLLLDEAGLNRVIAESLAGKEESTERREPGDLKTAMSRLNGACEELRTASGRRRYDASRLEDFKEEIGPGLDGASLETGSITAAAADSLIARGRGHYLTDADARAGVLAKAREMQISVEVPAAPRGRHVRCIQCDLDQPEADACVDCGAALHRTCPACESARQAVTGSCSQCGTNLLLRARSEAEVTQAASAMREGRVASAG
ncbi:MAG: hypothetical protein M3364_00370, partial [Actinomycetota bacterium]|nr:hypothetical protein [Actinomycetota bacterium]